MDIHVGDVLKMKKKAEKNIRKVFRDGVPVDVSKK